MYILVACDKNRQTIFDAYHRNCSTKNKAYKGKSLSRLPCCTSRSISRVGHLFFFLVPSALLHKHRPFVDSWFEARYDIMQCDITSLWGKSHLTRLKHEHRATQGICARVCVCVHVGTWHHNVITAQLHWHSCACWSRYYVRMCHASRAAAAAVVVIAITTSLLFLSICRC